MALRLDRLDGTDGFRIVGANTYGHAVSGAGDINGDGIDDVVVAQGYDAYVVFGVAGGLPSRVEVAGLNGTNGIRLSESNYSNYLALHSSKGDINSDGIEDLVLSAPASYLNPLGPDETFVVFGSSSGFPATIDLEALNGTNGFHLGESDPNLRAGDVNGDGLNDLILGLPHATSSAGNSVGAVAVVLGSTGGFPAHVGFPGLHGPLIQGVEEYGTTGWSVGVGDINGDGIDDMAIGAPGQPYFSSTYIAKSSVFVVFGTSSGFPEVLELASLDGTNGFRIPAINDYEHLGGSVAGAGDVNGDGIEDLIFSSGHRSEVRTSYVVFGNAHGFPAELDLTTLDGSNGFRIAGGPVAGAGDLNGDGIGDLIFVAPEGGSSYVAFGTADGFDADLDVTVLDGSNGFRIAGAFGGASGVDFNGDGILDLMGGSSVIFGSRTGFSATIDLSALKSHEGVSFDGGPTGAGDVNADGVDDLIFGASDVDENENGGAYVVYGSARLGGTNDAPTAADDSLNVRSLDVVDLAGDNGGGSDRDADLDDLTITAINGAAVAAGDSFDLASGIRVTLLGGADVRFESSVAPGISLSDSFEYEISDGQGGSDTAAVTVEYRQDALSLGSLDRADGFRLAGVVSGGFSGSSVARAGDLNADGLDDVVIGAPGASESYVLFGSMHGFPADVGALDGSSGFRIEGIDLSDGSGSTVASAGDVNGDGIDDVIITAPGAGTAGESYVLFGSADGFARNLDLGSLDGTNGFSLGGTDPSDPVRTAAGAGDVNGDGVDDLIFGVAAADRYDAVAVYLVFGSRNGFASRVDLTTLDASRGVRIDGMAKLFGIGSYGGIAVSGAGDVNGDGMDDAIVGDSADKALIYGSAHVVFGSRTGFTSSLGDLDGTNGFSLAGTEGFGGSGGSVAAAGDVNGDGLDDLIIGSSPYFSTIAESYVLFGSTEGFAAGISLAELDGNNGFRLVPDSEGGLSVAGIGDINGDGLDDLLVGTYVVFGSPDSFDAAVELASLDGSDGYRLQGAAPYDGTGGSGGSAGDLNGDGLDDLIVGAPFTNTDGTDYVGASYIVFGRRPASTGTMSASVAASSDDAEQAGPSAPLDLGSEDLDIGGQNHVGLRFTGLAIPDGARITGAHIAFEASASDSCRSRITVALEDSTAAAPFGPGAGRIPARDYNEETTCWRPEAWTKGETHRTADLAATISALIGTDGLEPDEALVFRFTGNGEREAASFESSGAAPRLVINFETDSSQALPVGEAGDQVPNRLMDLLADHADASGDRFDFEGATEPGVSALPWDDVGFA